MNDVFFVKKMPVDAGNLSITDITIVDDLSPERFGVSAVKLPHPGRYRVTTRIKNTWLGNRYRSKIMQFDSDTAYVGDLCYMVDSQKFDWEDERMIKHNPHLMFVETGGDGSFMMSVEFNYQGE